MLWQALELRGGQEARIDIEGAEPDYTFIFNAQAVAGGIQEVFILLAMSVMILIRGHIYTLLGNDLFLCAIYTWHAHAGLLPENTAEQEHMSRRPPGYFG